eukprot:gnl/MRDRNA2_/MRDRNA2_172037_c0_seq1.p1 gnl/MRDRNA2_/MRDRNA2_172037_c0~~gnl/MRDRNA2_/MRDRNA2_172037_c0_seq1.p1  ORF type:complete len:231 (+),score=56.15 gnl/MRDRNA2_/MRDRNA2_172037_c0_seq1:127-819(+)
MGEGSAHRRPWFCTGRPKKSARQRREQLARSTMKKTRKQFMQPRQSKPDHDKEIAPGNSSELKVSSSVVAPGHVKKAAMQTQQAARHNSNDIKSEAVIGCNDGHDSSVPQERAVTVTDLIAEIKRRKAECQVQITTLSDDANQVHAKNVVQQKEIQCRASNANHGVGTRNHEQSVLATDADVQFRHDNHAAIPIVLARNAENVKDCVKQKLPRSFIMVLQSCALNVRDKL